ncbi:MAG: hypothetical protein C0403_01020 [Desulfobacterium sp.]|nr:hypothetical protein [Desulfobacterium sp.]
MPTRLRQIALVGCFSVMIITFGCGKSEESKPATTGAQPTATAQPAVKPKKQSPEAIAAKLDKMGVKVQVKSEDEFLITEGFPYQKDLSLDYVIEIAKIEKGVFTASENSNVPIEMMGMVYAVAGGSFIPKCNAKEGTRTLADTVGNTWIFKESGMEFNVYLPAATSPVLIVRSRTEGAIINFTKEGVRLKGFILKPFGEP